MKIKNYPIILLKLVNGKYIRGQIDKGVLEGSNGLIQSIFNDYDYKHAADLLMNLQSIVTEYMKLSSYSVGISDLLLNDNKQKYYHADCKRKKKLKTYRSNSFEVFENNTGKIK